MKILTYLAFLKKQSIGHDHESKQSKTLTREEIYRFMKETCTDKRKSKFQIKQLN
jgi:hypothetical protein